MKKGRILENLEIVDIASNGKSLGRHEGQVVFVDKLVPGDVADVQIYKKRRRYVEARPVDIKTYSDKRAEPLCSHFGVCGGCKWQHLTYEDQLQYKHSHVSENVQKLSGIKLPEILPIIGSDEQYHYRNKMEYTFSNNRWLTEEEIKEGIEYEHRNALGFHVPGRFDKIVDIETCYLQEDISNRIRNFIRDYALKNDISFFDLREQTGNLRNLIVRTATTGDLMIVLSVTDYNDSTESLLNELSTEFPEITSLQYVVNQKKNDTIFDLEVVCFKGKDHIIEKMKNLNYKIGPKSFYQTNSKQAEKLYAIAKENAGIKSDDLVYDLYTGTGTIANYVADQAKKVVGIEYVEDAVKDAEINSKENDISNTEFHAGDMQKLLTQEFLEKNGRPDVIITDPPRAGMHADVVARINESGARTVVYVSCNPASQARDLELMDAQYEVTKLQPVDMFPNTAHVENVAVLKRRE